jgi:DNA-binding LytR/AlgR family response regulator
LSYQDWHQQQTKPSGNDLPINDPVVPDEVPISRNYLDVYDEEGQTHLPLQEVHYIEVKSKNYVAFTADQTYRIRATLAELEAALPICQFYRINRSVIVNLSYVKNYSFWENDKYIVRLKGNRKEFIMQRARLDEFKRRLTNHSAGLELH